MNVSWFLTVYLLLSLSRSLDSLVIQTFWTSWLKNVIFGLQYHHKHGFWLIASG